MDLQFLIDMKPKVLAVDSETTGLRWYDPAVKILTVQFTWKEGHSVIVPLHQGYYPSLTQRTRSKLKRQIKQLLTDPSIIKVGHNLKFDNHMFREKLGIQTVRGDLDTQLLAFCADDNMQSKSLDDCTRRWVPALAGYADAFNKETDKSQMINVPHDKMCQYGCGDTDATFRLAKRLLTIVQEDEKNWGCYAKVMMPAIQAFQDHIEPNGLGINTEELGNLQVVLDKRSKELYSELMATVPSAVKRKHIAWGASHNKGPAEALKFSRSSFVCDILFSKDGFGLKPVKFTKSTTNLDPSERIPSTSAKDHLPYFEDNPWVATYMEYTKLEKMRGTYGGKKGDENKQAVTGFWKYIFDGKIHPSYMLHRTNTGRTASSDPNGQNFPKRGALAKAYRKIFFAPKGYKLIECDLSQAELRIAAWMAGETNMIRIYNMGGDIHAATAAVTMGMEYEDYLEYKDDDTPLCEMIDVFVGSQSWLNQQEGKKSAYTIKQFLKAKRQQAKAINFGFLYGMGWRTFMTYAKTDYGVEFTEAEAKEVRKTFFRKYPRLKVWHEVTRQIVHERGYVRALHGAIRRLPNIASNDEAMVALAERNAVNSPVQRFASDLGLIALQRICRDMPEGLLKPVAFIHDALIFLVPEDRAEELAANVKWYMETPPLKEWFGLDAPLPIVADAEVGGTLADMEELEGLEAVCPDWYNEDMDLAA